MDLRDAVGFFLFAEKAKGFLAGIFIGAALGGLAVYAVKQEPVPRLPKYDHLNACIDMAGKDFNAVIEKGPDGTINCSIRPKVPISKP